MLRIEPRVVSPPPPTMRAMNDVISSVDMTSPSITEWHSSEMMSIATLLPSAS